MVTAFEMQEVWRGAMRMAIISGSYAPADLHLSFAQIGTWSQLAELCGLRAMRDAVGPELIIDDMDRLT